MALGNINLITMETLLPVIDPDLLLTRRNVSILWVIPSCAIVKVESLLWRNISEYNDLQEIANDRSN